MPPAGDGQEDEQPYCQGREGDAASMLVSRPRPWGSCDDNAASMLVTRPRPQRSCDDDAASMLVSRPRPQRSCDDNIASMVARIMAWAP